MELDTPALAPDPATSDELILTWAGDPADAPGGEEQPLQIDADLCHAVAVDLQTLGRGAEAETFYRAALALAPERSDTWANLGLIVLREHRVQEAIECERQALRIDPGNVEALNNLGIALHGLNSLSEAESHFHSVLRVAPDHANAMLNLGVIRQSLGHLEEAETLYRRARALGADEARVCNNLALALAELGLLEDAETTCRASLAANPGYPEAAVNLGMILLMRGKLAEAWSRSPNSRPRPAGPARKRSRGKQSSFWASKASAMSCNSAAMPPLSPASARGSSWPCPTPSRV
jgi:Flp pilus assembly protein TadD